MLYAVGAAWIVAAVVVIIAVWSLKSRIEKLISEEIQPTLQEVKEATANIDQLVGEARTTVARVDKVASTAEGLVSGAVITSAASKVVTGSKVTAVSLIAGLKEGLKALASRPSEPNDGE